MNLRRYRLIVWKEFLQFRRDRLLLPLVFMMPLLQLIMFGYVVGSDVTHLPTAMVDLDHTQTSRQIARLLESSGYFRVVAQPSSESSVQPLMDAQTVQVAFVIPAGTQRSLDRGETVPFGIVVDGTDSKTASVASGYASQIIGAYNQQRLAAVAENMNGPTLNASVRVLFNPSLRAVNAMVPGLVCTILLLSIMTIMAQAVVKERARGSLEQMMVTPLTRLEYLLGKITPYAIIAMAQMTFIALVGRLWFGVPFNGSVVTVALGLGLFSLTSIGLGLLISLMARTQQQAQQLAIFVMLPTIVLSGFMFPIESMPPAVVALTYVIPLRYALVVLRASFLKGSSIADLWMPMLAMLAFAVGIFGLAMARFSRKLAE